MRKIVTSAAALAVAAALGSASTLMLTESARGGSKRFPQLTLDQLDDAQRPLGEKIVKISSVGLAGPYNPLLRSPELANRMYDLLDYLRWRTSVPVKLNEFAILIQGRAWRSQVEWFAHAPLARKAGLKDSIIDDLKANRRPAGMTEDESAVYDFCTELAAKHAVSDGTYDRIRKVLNDQQIVDLTTLFGTYWTVAGVLAMAEESVPPGKDLPFKPGEP